MNAFLKICIALLTLSLPLNFRANDDVGCVSAYEVSAIGMGASKDFAPYMLGSWNHGKTVMGKAAMADARIWRPLYDFEQFSWGYGVEVLSGYSSKAPYQKWQPESSAWAENPQGPAAAWLQQLYGELKWRGVFLTIGMQEHQSALLNPMLSSGDLVESGNSRPIPEVRIGFFDFQDIPFTNGWVQIQGEISYGKMMDDKYMENHFNYYSSHINLGALYSYKRCYFRSNPSQPLSITAGMQVGAFFGGDTYYYGKGKPQPENTKHYSKSLKTFIKMFLPMGENGEDYYTGQSLGSWDFMASYMLPNEDEIMAYFQWPWEDGSGIGRVNGWDGVWGIEYRSAYDGPVSGFVVEYVDFRNQSGPIHWAPDDMPGTTITANATGRDDYYNNYYYNAYANYGMAIGTPFLISPVYNLDGYPAFACNRANGFHLGLMGWVSDEVEYRALASYQRGLGTYTNPYYNPRSDFSMMGEVKWYADRLLDGLSLKAQVGFDSGTLRGNNFGCMLTLSFSNFIWPR